VTGDLKFDESSLINDETRRPRCAFSTSFSAGTSLIRLASTFCELWQSSRIAAEVRFATVCIAAAQRLARASGTSVMRSWTYKDVLEEAEAIP
jgi:hypothetical protein